MSGIVKHMHVVRQFESERTYLDSLFVAGIKDVTLNEKAQPTGVLYLDTLTRTQKRMMTYWLGQPINPPDDYDPMYIQKTEKREQLFKIKKIVIPELYPEFVENIQRGLLTQGLSMEHAATTSLFQEVHGRYKGIYELIHPQETEKILQK